MSFRHQRLCGLEPFAERKFWQSDTIVPILVWVDIEIVPRQNDNSMCTKCLFSILDLDIARLAFCVFGATGKKSTCDELIDSLLFGAQLTGSNPSHWMDGRVSFIIISSLSWRIETSVYQTLGIPTPSLVCNLFFNQDA